METNVSKSQVREQVGRKWKEQAVELALLGRWDEAVQMNLRILELFPDDIGAQNRLGKAYRELGRLEEAVTAYEESLKRQPSNPIARKNLTALYTALDREPQALAGTTESDDYEDDSEAEDNDGDEERPDEDDSD
jgi:Flp pilus assembly protein TadD